MHTCDVCNAKVSELRRGRCWGCYARWVDARPVGLGARCITCHEKRRRALKMVELWSTWKPMCFNCAGQLLDLDPLPTTIAALRAIVSRERRQHDRRIGKPDSRVFRYERRVGERRTVRAEATGTDAAALLASAGAGADDDLVIEISIEPDGALASRDHDFDDITQIRELVRELRPPGGDVTGLRSLAELGA